MQRKSATLLLLLLALISLAVNVGCGGVTASTTPNQPIAPAVVVTPGSISLRSGDTQQFTAAVTGLSSTAVNWSASGGSINSSGLYSAPSAAGTYTVTATSTADSTKSGSATVTVTAANSIAISISPSSVSLLTGGTQQFTANVTGSSNTAVTWSATGGTISNAGVYTAPATGGTYTVTATSSADSSKTASATVNVNAVSTQLLSASPTIRAFGDLLVGNSSSLTVTLSNTGNSPVTVSAANFTGGVFSAPGLTLPLTIAAGATSSVDIVFTPDISGPFSGTVSFVSDASNSPATVSLSGTGIAPVAHSVDLMWVGSTSTEVTGYHIYRSTASGGGYAKLNTSPEPTTTYTDSAVQSGITYFYVVTAVDDTGAESVFSNEAQAVIPIP